MFELRVGAQCHDILVSLKKLKADLHGTTLSHAINLRQVYDMNRFV